jgi:hypothetical protein
MKFGLGILCSLCFLALGSAQDNSPSKPRPSPPFGLEVGQNAPAFASGDQFGHDQSNETLKGSNGTVLLFFRSADW